MSNQYLRASAPLNDVEAQEFKRLTELFSNPLNGIRYAFAATMFNRAIAESSVDDAERTPQEAA